MATSHQPFTGRALILVTFVLLCGCLTSTSAQAPKIQLTEPVVGEAQDALKIAFKVSGASQKRIRVKVDSGVSAVTSDEIKFANDGEHVIKVNLFKGDNTITLIGFNQDEPVDNLLAPIRVKCTGRWCKEPFSLTPNTVAGEFGESTTSSGTAQTGGGGKEGGGGQTPPKTAGNITILTPPPGKVQTGLITSVISVKKSDIQTLLVLVDNAGKSVAQPKDRIPITYNDDLAIVRPRVRLSKGENTITFVSLDNPLDKSNQASVTVNCEGECNAPAATVADAIRINSPEGGAQLQDAPYVLSKITIKKTSNISRLFVRVLNNGKPLEKPLVGDGDSLEVKFDATQTEAVLTPKIKVKEGTNVITVFDAAKSIDDSPQDSTELTCTGEKCGEGASATADSKITIEKPEDATTVNANSVGSYLTVAKDSGIAKIKFDVKNADKVLVGDAFTVPAPSGENPSKLVIPVRIAKGTNKITFYDAAKETDPAREEASTTVVCDGDKCAEDFLIARYSGSQHSRSIVGFEQAGGSSAGSETKPVLDFFFLTPFLFDKRKNCDTTPALTGKARTDCDDENLRRRLLPRFGFWGDVRLASTPDQVAAAQVFPTNLVNQVSTPGKFIDLVQSFDFLAGLEARIKTGNGSFLSLIPGIRQKTSLYFAAGGGAISPLNATRERIQLFNVPGVNDPRREDFINRFGVNGAIPPQPGTNPPKEKEFVAILPIDRDRFLHQWYAGFRLKTLYCEDDGCTRFKNSFPAIVDFMIGQNEAVTGGSRKRGGTPDPNNPDKLIGGRNSYVLRLDAFYPFPIKEANFIYFYGTALMKIGAGGVKVTTPLFLDNPGTTVELSDPRVYIPPINILKLQQPDRDYYKIGVGVNLTELFNRNKSE